MGLADSCNRFILLLFNAVFAICGIVLVALGVVLKVLFDDYLNFEGNSVWSPSIFIIILGITVFLVASFGCFGASQKNACLIYTFAFIMSCIFMVEIGAAITAAVMQKQVKASIEETLQDAMMKYNVTYHGYHGTTVWDSIQKEFLCCGVVNYTQWAQTPFGQNGDVPDSCCKKAGKGCGKGALEVIRPQMETKVYHEGCWKMLEELLRGKILIVVAVSAGVLLLQVLEIVMACSLGRSIQKGYKRLQDEQSY